MATGHGRVSDLAGIPLKAATNPPSPFWYLGEQIQYAGYLAPICLVVLVGMFVIMPPRGAGKKAAAVILGAPTIYLAWNVILVFLYYAGFSSFPNI